MIQEEYEGSVYTIEFLQGHPLRKNCYGKTWNKVTQCIIKKDNLIIGTGEVIKHANDTDNIKYAKSKSAKKAFKQTRLWKEIRTRLWNKILKD